MTEARLRSTASLPADPLDASLRSGWGAFDDLGLVRPGRVVLLDVAPAAAPAASAFVAGLVVHGVATGRRVLVIEASGSPLDDQALDAAARRIGLPRHLLADGVRVSRPATPRALATLLDEALPAALADDDAAAVLVLGLPEAFLVPRGRPGAERRARLADALVRLGEVAREAQVPILLATPILTTRASRSVRDLLVEGVDEALCLLAGPVAESLHVRIPHRGVALVAEPGAVVVAMPATALDSERLPAPA